MFQLNLFVVFIAFSSFFVISFSSAGYGHKSSLTLSSHDNSARDGSELQNSLDREIDAYKAPDIDLDSLFELFIGSVSLGNRECSMLIGDDSTRIAKLMMKAENNNIEIHPIHGRFFSYGGSEYDEMKQRLSKLIGERKHLVTIDDEEVEIIDLGNIDISNPESKLFCDYKIIKKRNYLDEEEIIDMFTIYFEADDAQIINFRQLYEERITQEAIAESEKQREIDVQRGIFILAEKMAASQIEKHELNFKKAGNAKLSTGLVMGGVVGLALAYLWTSSGDT